MTEVFVYGTLRPGGDAHLTVLGDVVRAAHRASLPGFDMFGEGLPFPYVRDGSGTVHGELLELAGDEDTLAALDHYEGDTYVRRRVNVDVGGDRRGAWTYVARTDVELADTSRIPSGDWLAR